MCEGTAAVRTALRTALRTAPRTHRARPLRVACAVCSALCALTGFTAIISCFLIETILIDTLLRFVIILNEPLTVFQFTGEF